MARVPAHRRKRDPLRRQIPGVAKTPPCACGVHPHERHPDGTWGRCRWANCACLQWRPQTRWTCTLCGQPVPAGAARCEQQCQPRVVKAEVAE